jgi:plasmid stabilization system protein ParE
MLETAPGLGRPVSNHAELREFLIEFGDSGYVVLYRHEGADESIVILAFRHQKEAGY